MTVDTVMCTIPGCAGGRDGRPWESPEGLTTYASRESMVRNHLDMDNFSNLNPNKDKLKESSESKFTKDSKT